MPSAARDLTFGLIVSRMDAELGREVMFSYKRGDKEEPVRLKIPQGIADGTKLRLQGMGLEDSAGGPPGDLYLEINIR
jgi:DnaJ-class molecular chaperone